MFQVPRTVEFLHLLLTCGKYTKRDMAEMHSRMISMYVVVSRAYLQACSLF